MNSLFKRSILKLFDLNIYEINYILFLASKLKYLKYIKKEIKFLKNKNILLIFDKDSTRTRCSFEVAAFDQGINVTYFNSSFSQMFKKESVKDTARILGQLYDAIQYRGYEQSNFRLFAKYSGIPVWNGLSNKFHPTQILSDLLTIQECLPNKPFNLIKLVFIGDICNNICNTFLEAAALVGINLVLISPKIFWPNIKYLSFYFDMAKKMGGSISFTEDINSGVYKADFIYTDVWLSMGQNNKMLEKRIFLFKNYQVNMKMLEKTNNYNVKFMHCLPSLHDKFSYIGKKISEKYNLFNGIEVTNEVFNSEYSIVFAQANNRLHIVKSIMLSTLLKKYLL